MNKKLKILAASLIITIVHIMAAPFFPGTIPSEVSAMEALQGPNGFADLFWEEKLTDIQDSHPTKLLGFSNGIAAYHIQIPDAHGSVYFQGPVTVRGLFAANKLFGIMIAFDKSQMSRRVQGMTKLYGPPNKEENGAYAWEGPFSFIMIAPQEKAGIVTILAKPQKDKK